VAEHGSAAPRFLVGIVGHRAAEKLSMDEPALSPELQSRAEATQQALLAIDQSDPAALAAAWEAVAAVQLEIAMVAPGGDHLADGFEALLAAQRTGHISREKRDLLARLASAGGRLANSALARLHGRQALLRLAWEMLSQLEEEAIPAESALVASWRLEIARVLAALSREDPASLEWARATVVAYDRVDAADHSPADWYDRATAAGSLAAAHRSDPNATALLRHAADCFARAATEPRIAGAALYLCCDALLTLPTINDDELDLVLDLIAQLEKLGDPQIPTTNLRERFDARRRPS
jgi:hypothetical protein